MNYVARRKTRPVHWLLFGFWLLCACYFSWAEEKPENFTNSLGQNMIWVEAGEIEDLFYKTNWGEENPIFEEAFLSTMFPKVAVKQGYYLAAKECTQIEWQLLMGENPSAFGGGDNKPVESVSWFDAVKFCQRLTERERKLGRLPEGFEYRLPTEMQWEWAARARNDQHLWGPVQEIAWYRVIPVNRPKEWFPGPRPVAQKQANEWGFYDMHGNVFEWCADWSDQGLALRSTRGGGWHSHYLLSQASARFGADPHLVSSDQGFRPALVPASNQAQSAQELLQAALEQNAKPLEQEQDSADEKVQAEQNMQAPPQPEQKWTNSLGQEFVWIRPGFLEGVEQNIPDDGLLEKNLLMRKGFHMAATECTRWQWVQLMGNEEGLNAEDEQANLPITEITWAQAREFALRLTTKERLQGSLPKGWRYALPTEDQWEWACRAGTAGMFAGNIQELAWQESNSGGEVQLVAQKQANAWGLYDMHGNVAEFCEEWEYGNRTRRKVKGGHFQSKKPAISSAALAYLAPNDAQKTISFRLVLVADKNP